MYNELSRSNMQIFTIEDYVKVLHALRKYPSFRSLIYADFKTLREENAIYTITELNNVNNENDKMIRGILDVKSDVVDFLNKILKTNFKVDELEKYNRDFVTLDFEDRRSDIIYKLKNRNVFFLIEHQTYRDYKMPIRILEYTLVIMKSAIEHSKIGNKGYKLPLVVPIVIYTNEKEWNVKTYIKEVQESLEMEYGFKFGEYKVVTLNDFTEEELLESKTGLSKILYILKHKDETDMTMHLAKVAEEISFNKKQYDPQSVQIVIRVIQQILQNKISLQKANELVEKIKGGKEDMGWIEEAVAKENELIRNQGRKEGRKENAIQMIKNMLKQNASISFIEQVSGFSQEQIEKIAKKISKI